MRRGISCGARWIAGSVVADVVGELAHEPYQLLDIAFVPACEDRAADPLAGRIHEAEAAGDEPSADIQRVGKCLELPDAFPLPELAALTPAAE